VSEDNDEKYAELMHLTDEEVKLSSGQEELKLRLLEQQCDALSINGEDQSARLEAEKEQAARQQDELMQQIKDKLPVICDQLLQLRLFLVESQGDEQMIRFAQNVKHRLQQLNCQKPNLNRLISELLVRNSHDSDVKLVHLAKSMYGHKLLQLLDQLQSIGLICGKSIEFLKTKLYGGFLVRKAVNEMNLLTQEMERSNQVGSDVDEATSSVDKCELQFVKQMLDFDFNGGLTQLKSMLNDQLKRFDETGDSES
jgi:hypothetical protein